MNTNIQVELLAPAGNWDCARAAVENGADAIYFGLDVGFNARARATNFHAEQLEPLMNMLHRQAVRGYVTLNTLVFTDELLRLEENVRLLAGAGVDAVLVQDMGVARIVREICPELEVHASTQMTLTNADAISVAAELGLNRVVLARELSIKEITRIASETNMPLEVFVHGALCVAYSGQCLTSESMGGRSANRGQCAQACRLPYDLYCDGQHQDLGPVKYLMSPQDLAAHDLVPQLIAAGVTSLKIEGRLKTPEYVANVCGHYRAAIDEALAGRQRTLSKEQLRELELSFSRGFSPGWLEGCDHKRLVPGRSSTKRGAYLGKILRAQGDDLTLECEAPLSAGDGIVLEGDRFADNEIGGRIYELYQSGKSVKNSVPGAVTLRMKRGFSSGKKIRAGTNVWKTDDPRLTRALRQTFHAADPIKRVPIDIEVQVNVGKPIAVQANSADGFHVQFVSSHCPEVARKHAVTHEQLAKQLGRLGGSVYVLRGLQSKISEQAMVPLSVLGKLRKQLIRELDSIRQMVPRSCNPQQVVPRLLQNVRCDASEASSWKVLEPKLRVLCRSLKQLEAAVAAGVEQVIADFQDVREYRQAVCIARSSGASIELASLRIQKPGETGLLRAMQKHFADGWLVRNLVALQFAISNDIPATADFSLNVTNPLTAQQLRAWGATRVTASYDLNRDQLMELVQATPADWVEVVIHQHMPMFHMEHCVFCAVLSPGKNKSDCGRPCDRHDVQLKDRVGAMHSLHADIGCRNTLYNAQAQSGAEAVRPLLQAGVRHFRIELLRDAPEREIKNLIELYRRLLAGELQGADVWRELKADNRVGVTRGTLEQPRNPLAIL